MCFSDASVSGIGGPLSSSVKNKHLDDEEEEGMEEEEHEVKRLKFNEDGNEEDEDEDVDEQVVEKPRATSSKSSSDKSEDAESPSSMLQEGSEEEEESKPHVSVEGPEDQGSLFLHFLGFNTLNNALMYSILC